jgi:predicted nucleic acid-binding protein
LLFNFSLVDAASLSANILSAILRKEPETTERAKQALAANDELILCPVVFFEVYRGLLHRDAKKQLEFFMRYSTTLIWSDLTRQDWLKAGQMWADLRRRGLSIQDADVLIGAFASQRNAVVVTNNDRHFTPLGLAVETWRR